MIMGMYLEWRNIAKDEFAESNEFPHHIPIPEPPLNHKKGGSAKLLS